MTTQIQMQQKWEVSIWWSALASISTSGSFLVKELVLGSNLVWSNISLSSYLTSIYAFWNTIFWNLWNIMFLSSINIQYTCSAISNQSLLPVFFYLFPATEHWDIGHHKDLTFVKKNILQIQIQTQVQVLGYWAPQRYL